MVRSLVWLGALGLVACGSSGGGGSGGAATETGGTAGVPSVGDGGQSGATSGAGGTSSAGTGGASGASGGVPFGGGGVGAADSGTPRLPEAGAPPGLVPTFVAVGHMERTTVSCDDGQSWIANTSLDDSVRCFENGLDCDHTKGAGRGLAYGDGWFVASFGWGEPGRLRRSHDGITWETAKDGTIFAGVAFGGGTFVANASPALISLDGNTWHTGSGDLGLTVGNTRSIGYFAQGGGTFVVTGETGDARDVVLSRTGGETWVHPTTVPAECIAWVRGTASSGSSVVLASGKGYVCTSVDAGATWQVVQLGTDNLSSAILWTGAEYTVWNRNVLYTSADGLTWSSVDTVPSTVSIGAVARSPNGTFVATNDGWLVWYEKQEFYRSTDGVHWDVLDASKFTGSHPINFIEFGWAEPSAACPAP